MSVRNTIKHIQRHVRERVDLVCKQSGKTHQEIAALASIGETDLDEYLAGYREFSGEELYLLSIALNVSIQVFYDGIDFPPRVKKRAAISKL